MRARVDGVPPGYRGTVIEIRSGRGKQPHRFRIIYGNREIAPDAYTRPHDATRGALTLVKALRGPIAIVRGGRLLKFRGRA